MLISVLVAFGFAAMGVALARSQRKQIDASWKQLAPAVPDDKALEGAPYRDAGAREQEPTSRKALALRPDSARVKRSQELAAVAAPAAAALLLGAFQPAALGAWASVLGGAWGLGAAAAMLGDDRRALGVLAMLASPLVFVSFGGGVALLAVYAALRIVLDQKDDAAHREADRERIADPRFLAGLTERRAGGVARSRRGGGGDITGPTARDNSRA